MRRRGPVAARLVAETVVAARLGLAVGIVLLAGCDRGSTATLGTAASAPTTTSPSGGATPARTSPSARSGRPTPPPSPVEGPCRYLDSDTVAGIVGQHITRSTVTPTRPYPGCTFYRPNGEAAANIAVTVLATPTQAQAKAIAIGGQAANPVNGLGDGGVVAIADTGGVLAVSTGRTLIVVRINQRSSLEAKELARSVLAAL